MLLLEKRKTIKGIKSPINVIFETDNVGVENKKAIPSEEQKIKSKEEVKARSNFQETWIWKTYEVQ